MTDGADRDAHGGLLVLRRRREGRAAPRCTELKGTANTTGKMLDAMASTTASQRTGARPRRTKVGRRDRPTPGRQGGRVSKRPSTRWTRRWRPSGSSLGPLPGMLDELASAAGKSVTELGLLGTAGAVVAAGRWPAGRSASRSTNGPGGVTRSPATPRQLMGWGDVAAQEAAAGADTLARASALAGREITDMAVAVRILQDAAVAATAEQKKLAAETEAVRSRRRTLRHLRGRLFGYDDINRAEMYRVGPGRHRKRHEADHREKERTARRRAADRWPPIRRWAKRRRRRCWRFCAPRPN